MDIQLRSRRPLHLFRRLGIILRPTKLHLDYTQGQRTFVPGFKKCYGRHGGSDRTTLGERSSEVLRETLGERQVKRA